MSNTAVLDENGIATLAGDITVYHYDEETREYTSSSVEYLARGGYPGTFMHRCPARGNAGLRDLPDVHAGRVGVCPRSSWRDGIQHRER